MTWYIHIIYPRFYLIYYRTRTTDQSPQATWKCVCRAKVKCEKDPKDLAVVHHAVMMKTLLSLTLFLGELIFFVVMHSIRAWTSNRLWVSLDTQMTGTSTFFQDLWMRHWRRYFLDHHSWQFIISCRWRMWSLDWYGVIQKCLGSISKVVSLLGMLHCCKIWQAWRMWIICRSFRFFLHWNKETFGLLQAVGPRLRWSADFGWHLEEVGVQFTVHFSHFIIPLPWYWISNGWISTMMWYLVPSRPSMCDMTSRWRWIWDVSKVWSH